MSQAIAARQRTSAPQRPFSPRTRGLAATAGALVLAIGTMAPVAAFAREAPASYADLVAKVAPAVVNVSAEREQKVAQAPNGVDPRMLPFPEGSPFRQFFRRFYQNNPGGFGGPRMRSHPRMRKLIALGSGFIIDPAGYVVTNNHVVKNATRIKVILNDGTKYNAKLVGTDPRTDLALLKIKADHKFPYVQWGDSDKARVGDRIIAVGNPYGLGGTVTAGIVSARGRDIGNKTIVDYLQIDAPINHGNSGGPTFNMNGKVIGVNTAIYSPNGGSIGLGFAIPSDTAKPVIEALREHGKIAHGWLGVQIQPVTQDLAKALNLKKREGAIVAAVFPNSPAAKAGLKSGDLILRWNDHPVKSVRDLVRKVSDTKAGARVDAVVLRNGSRKSLAVEVGLYKPSNLQASLHRKPSSNSPAAVGKLGLGLTNLTPAVRNRFNIAEDVTKGAVVVAVKPNSPADDKGLRPGDVITRVGNTDVASADQVAKAVASARKQHREALLFKIIRNGNTRYLGLPLAS
jgi:serine protease Do